jgi:hypothetical protein
MGMSVRERKEKALLFRTFFLFAFSRWLEAVQAPEASGFCKESSIKDDFSRFFFPLRASIMKVARRVIKKGEVNVLHVIYSKKRRHTNKSY